MNKRVFVCLLFTCLSLSACASFDMSRLSNDTSNEGGSTPGETPKEDPYIDDGVVGTNTLTINSDAFTNIGNYSTGNYTNVYSASEINTIDEISFMHYRAVKESGYAMKLLPYIQSNSDGTRPGAIYNSIDTPIKGITDIEITYKNVGSSSSGLSLKLGQNKLYNDEFTIVGEYVSSATQTKNFRVRKYDPYYFQIESAGSTLYIESISIKYTNKGDNRTSTYNKSGEGKTRSKITKQSSLIDGSTTGQAKDKNGQLKTYTYYSYSYCQSNPDVVSNAVQTDPVDVSNYYLLFGCAPANYGSSTSATSSVFGSDSRQVSNYYSRTDGYVQAFAGGVSSPKYIELDIGVGGQYNGRGVGRVVVFEKGINGYDSFMAVYTDDHYATFQEYLNDGTFSARFNAQCPVTNYVHSLPTMA